MDKVKLFCVKCDRPMFFMSSSGINFKPDYELWYCPKCNMEVNVCINEVKK